MKSISSSNEFKKSKIKVKMENDMEYEIETKNEIFRNQFNKVCPRPVK